MPVYVKGAIPLVAVMQFIETFVVWISRLKKVAKSLLYNNDLSNSIYVGELTNFLVIGHQIRGAGLIAEIPTSMSITITSCRIYGDDSSWHNLTSPYITNTFGKMLNFGDTYISQGFVTQGLSYLIEITGTSMRNN